MLNKILIGVCIASLVATLTFASLWNKATKDVGVLQQNIIFLQSSLESCKQSVKKEKERMEAKEETYSTLLLNYQTLDGEYGSLKNQLNNQRCRVNVQKPKDVQSSIPDNTVDDIRNVGRLLDKAACTANRDCPNTAR